MPNGTHNVVLTFYPPSNYSFSGGSDGKGKCENRVNQGAAPVQITLTAVDGCSINDMSADPPGIVLSGPGSSQMRATVTGNNLAAIITNPCTSTADVDYTVNVMTPNGTVIPCHPKIVNN